MTGSHSQILQLLGLNKIILVHQLIVLDLFTLKSKDLEITGFVELTFRSLKYRITCQINGAKMNRK